MQAAAAETGELVAVLKAYPTLTGYCTLAGHADVRVQPPFADCLGVVFTLDRGASKSTGLQGDIRVPGSDLFAHNTTTRISRPLLSTGGDVRVPKASAVL